MSQIDKDVFKQAMGHFPSGAVIVTTINNDGQKCGFTASAFNSLSLDPPLILACLANSSDCYQSFMSNEKFAVNIISEKQHELAFKFATKGADKFNGNEFITGESGLPIIPDCALSLECDLENIYPGGDHEILIGAVKYTNIYQQAPSIWYQGSFSAVNSEE